MVVTGCHAHRRGVEPHEEQPTAKRRKVGERLRPLAVDLDVDTMGPRLRPAGQRLEFVGCQRGDGAT
jgi:hypothetical protein